VKLLLIAGTSEARQLADQLVARGDQVLAAVATGVGEQLLTNPALTVLTGRKGRDEWQRLLIQTTPDYLVDASHPFAQSVSTNAMAAAEAVGVPYLRLERPDLAAPQRERVHWVADYRQAACLADQLSQAKGGRVLLTVGSNQLAVFVEEISPAAQRLFARVLPTSEVLQKCEQLGLGVSNLLAAKGPFSLGMNLETIRLAEATVMVSKESGDLGGVEEKIGACGEAGIDLVLIARPRLAYPLQFDSTAALLDYLR